MDLRRCDLDEGRHRGQSACPPSSRHGLRQQHVIGRPLWRRPHRRWFRTTTERHLDMGWNDLDGEASRDNAGRLRGAARLRCRDEPDNAVVSGAIDWRHHVVLDGHNLDAAASQRRPTGVIYPLYDVRRRPRGARVFRSAEGWAFLADLDVRERPVAAGHLISSILDRNRDDRTDQQLAVNARTLATTRDVDTEAGQRDRLLEGAGVVRDRHSTTTFPNLARREADAQRAARARRDRCRQCTTGIGFAEIAAHHDLADDQWFGSVIRERHGGWKTRRIHWLLAEVNT